jgi:hypothetical protein
MPRQVLVLQRQPRAQRSRSACRPRPSRHQQSATDTERLSSSTSISKCHIRHPPGHRSSRNMPSRARSRAAGKDPCSSCRHPRTSTSGPTSPQPKLADVRLGQRVKVATDFATSNRQDLCRHRDVGPSPARARFTRQVNPHRRRSRRPLYAEKVGVKNDGYIKIGMVCKVSHQTLTTMEQTL